MLSTRPTEFETILDIRAPGSLRHAPGSLRHAPRLETSWPGQWLRYLAAVLSICEYIRYLIKGACRVTVMTVTDRGAYAPTTYILWGQMSFSISLARYGITD